MIIYISTFQTSAGNMEAVIFQIEFLCCSSAFFFLSVTVPVSLGHCGNNYLRIVREFGEMKNV